MSDVLFARTCGLHGSCASDDSATSLFRDVALNREIREEDHGIERVFSTANTKTVSNAWVRTSCIVTPFTLPN